MCLIIETQLSCYHLEYLTAQFSDSVSAAIPDHEQQSNPSVCPSPHYQFTKSTAVCRQCSESLLEWIVRGMCPPCAQGLIRRFEEEELQEAEVQESGSQNPESQEPESQEPESQGPELQDSSEETAQNVLVLDRLSVSE